MKPCYCLVFLLFTYAGSVLHAQRFSANHGAHTLAMGGSAVALQGAFSAVNNQAGLAEQENLLVGVSFHYLYHTIEMSERAAFLAVPSRYGVWFGSVSDYGFSEYRETKLGLGFSRQFGELFSMALQFDYLSILFSPEQGAEASYTFEGGVIFSLVEDLDLGMHVFNPLGSAIKAAYHAVEVPAVVRLGLAYQLEESLLLHTELEVVAGQSYSPQFGVEYKTGSTLSLRAGVAGRPFIYSFGCGVTRGMVTLDAAAYFHRDLGFSSAMSILLTFGGA